MKKLLVALTAILFVSTSLGSSSLKVTSASSKLYASEVYITIGETGNKISLLELSKISRPDLEKLTGSKMNFFEKQAFRISQKKLTRGIDENGLITNKKLTKFFGPNGIDGEKGFHLGGFALGLFLGAIGVLITYLIKDDKSKNRTKWAWIGFGIFLVVYLAVVVLTFSSIY